MPHASPSTVAGFPPLCFRPASERERRLTWTRNSASWSGPLSVDAYIQREEYLGSQLLTKGHQRYWILTTLETSGLGDEKSDEELSDTILAACESYGKRALVKDREGVREVGTHGVASVYCHPGHRKKGLASVMMRKLAEWFDEEGDCEVTTLYADVGKRFYTVLGWPDFPSFEVSLPVCEWILEDTDDIHLIKDSEISDLCSKDVAQLREYFQHRQLSADETALFANLPTTEQILWHHARANFIGKQTTGKQPEIRGARSGDNTWAIWNHDFNGRVLVILRVVTPLRRAGEEPKVREKVVESLKLILEAASNEAAKWGFGSVVVWNPDEEVQAAYKQVDQWKKIEVVDREEDSVPSLRWTAKEGRDEGYHRKTVWVANEKFAWL